MATPTSFHHAKYLEPSPKSESSNVAKSLDWMSADAMRAADGANERASAAQFGRNLLTLVTGAVASTAGMVAAAIVVMVTS